MSIREDRLMKWAQNKDLKRLHKALDMPDHEDRLKAVIYIGLVKDESSLPQLKKLVNDPSEEILRHAAHAIKGIAPDDFILESFSRAIKRRMLIDGYQENRNADDHQLKKLLKEQKVPFDERPIDFKAIDSYARRMERLNKTDRIKSWFFAILVTLGLAAIIYIAYSKLG